MENDNAKPASRRRMSRKRVHWYMSAVSVDYIEPELKDGQPTGSVFKRTQTINAILQQSENKNIVAKTMESVRELVLQRMVTQYKMDPKNLLDFTVMNMIYMGHMSEHEYFTTGQEKPQVA